MAAVNVTLVGLGNGEPFTFVGMASLTGLGVGGGPMPPPVGIWPNPPEGIAPHPEHPIVIPPGKPDVPPPTIWPPGPGVDFPAHPIVLPPDNPVIPPGSLVTWKAVWSEDTGWLVVGVPNVPHPAPS